MGVERDFVKQVAQSVKDAFQNVTTFVPNDQMTLGAPDLLAWCTDDAMSRTMAVEAKQLLRLLSDPRDPGRRTEPLLHHPFTGPQVAFLRSLMRSRVEAYGLIRVSVDYAIRVSPMDIPIGTGNFTHAELMAVGTLIRRGSRGWVFWEGNDAA